MKKRIAVIFGGDSEESVISVKSARTIYDNINRKKYEPYLLKMMNNIWEVELEDGSKCPVHREDLSFDRNNERISFDGVFITIHGTPGENGKLQGYLDMIGMPYNTCNTLISAITFHKGTTIRLLDSMGFNCANSIVLHKNSLRSINEVMELLAFPCFVKPNSGGSSFGITKVKHRNELEAAVNLAFKEDDEVMVEEFMEGREFTNGAFRKGEEVVVMPITEIIPKAEFFDFAAKYEGAAEEITPANLPERQTEMIRKETEKIYRSMGLRGLVRIDYILKDNLPYVIEINTTPGMSAESIVPQQAAAMGMSLSDLFDIVLEELRFDYPRR